MKDILTADPHFGHGNIIKYCHRPFLSAADAAELARRGGSWHSGIWKSKTEAQWKISDESIKMMDDELLDNINSMTDLNDRLYILGDYAYGIRRGYYERCAEYRSRIRCRNVFLIWGNHDRPEIADLFSYTTDLAFININGYKVQLSHYAMVVWNRSHKGSLQFYGHSHKEIEDHLDSIMPNRKNLDVGVDNAARLLGKFRPFLFTEALDIILSRPSSKVAPQNEPPPGFGGCTTIV